MAAKTAAGFTQTDKQVENNVLKFTEYKIVKTTVDGVQKISYTNRAVV